jgi:hypothetical protein
LVKKYVTQLMAFFGSKTEGADAWERLYDEYTDAESRRAERQRKLDEEEAALQEFEGWTRGATEQLMRDLRTAAEERSETFLQRTGHTLQVEYPSGPTIALPEGGPEIRFLRLSLGEARVHVYSSHTPGGLVHIHLLPSRRDSLQHNQRLLSEPGAFVVRRADDGYELRFLNGDPEGVARSAMSADGLLFKAFRLLVHWAADPSPRGPPRSRGPQSNRPEARQSDHPAPQVDTGVPASSRPEGRRPAAVTQIAFLDADLSPDPRPGAAGPLSADLALGRSDPRS